METENPVCTLGDYSRPSHEGYLNIIELPVGSNVVPLRSDAIWLVQNECSFNGLRSDDPNQHLKDFLKLVDSLDLTTRLKDDWEKQAQRRCGALSRNWHNMRRNGGMTPSSKKKEAPTTKTPV
ncbi:hypothetical protein Tco_1197039 [Tanacetum coccineum]